ncbi:MAG TPA: hypothetical protein VFB72_21090, partial [Verrucomicrobiae bacterium]|nr:hypothetical protein [Verrucomicrobiae bacterium]
FSNVTGKYALAFSAPSNSIVVASRSYSRWLPPARKDFFLVQEKPPERLSSEKVSHPPAAAK